MSEPMVPHAIAELAPSQAIHSWRVVQTCNEGSFVGVACSVQEEMAKNACAEHKTFCLLDRHECNSSTLSHTNKLQAPCVQLKGHQGTGFSICSPSAGFLAWPLLCTA